MTFWEHLIRIFYVACIVVVAAYMVTFFAAPSLNQCLFRGIC